MRQKLKSQSGASMLIALVFFFLCVTVGIIVLTAAASNSGQLTHVKEQRQAYLATSSAARLIREDVSKVSFQKVVTETYIKDEDGEEYLYGTPTTTYAYPQTFDYGQNGPLAKTLQSFCDSSAWGKDSGSASPQTLTITAEEGLPVVTAVWNASKTDLNLTVLLSIEDKYALDHPLILTLTAETITKENKENSSIFNKEEESIPCTITTTTTTIKWTGLIGKGAAT